jgi:hypothetical protein
VIFGRASFHDLSFYWAMASGTFARVEMQYVDVSRRRQPFRMASVSDDCFRTSCGILWDSLEGPEPIIALRYSRPATMFAKLTSSASDREFSSENLTLSMFRHIGKGDIMGQTSAM